MVKKKHHLISGLHFRKPYSFSFEWISWWLNMSASQEMKLLFIHRPSGLDLQKHKLSPQCPTDTRMQQEMHHSLGRHFERSFQSSQLSAETAKYSCQVWVFLTSPSESDPRPANSLLTELEHHWTIDHIERLIRFTSPTENRTFWQGKKCPSWGRLNEVTDKNPDSLGCTCFASCQWRISSLFSSSLFTSQEKDI